MSVGQTPYSQVTLHLSNKCLSCRPNAIRPSDIAPFKQRSVSQMLFCQMACTFQTYVCRPNVIRPSDVAPLKQMSVSQMFFGQATLYLSNKCLLAKCHTAKRRCTFQTNVCRSNVPQPNGVAPLKQRSVGQMLYGQATLHLSNKGLSAKCYSAKWHVPFKQRSVGQMLYGQMALYLSNKCYTAKWRCTFQTNVCRPNVLRSNILRPNGVYLSKLFNVKSNVTFQ